MNAQFIYGGGGEITLYDATNGYYNVGYVENIDISAEKQLTTTSHGMEIQVKLLYKLTAMMLESNAAFLQELRTRRTVKQTVYIVGAGKLVTLTNMFLKYFPVQPFNTNDVHKVNIEMQTAVEPTFVENLYGTDGEFSTDAGSGIATGWSEASTLAAKSVTTSHLAGMGNAQAMTITGGSAAGIYKLSRVAPFALPTIVTFSAYFKAVAASSFSIKMAPFNSSGSGIATYTKAVSMTLNEETRQTYSLLIKESVLVTKVQIEIRGNGVNSAQLLIDNAQLELSNVRDFRAY